MKVQPTTKELIAMLYERLPELFDRAAPVQSIEHCIWARNGNTPCPHTTLPPPQRIWVGLTDEHIERIYDRYGGDMMNCAGAIERELREMNNG